MKKTIQVRVYRGEKYFVAECLDLPVVTQGKNLDEVVENVREAIGLHLQDEDMEELDISPEFSIIVNFEVEPLYAKT